MYCIKNSLLVTVLLAALGCGGTLQLPPPSSSAPSTAPLPPSASAVDFEELLKASVAELQAKNETHRDWGLGSFDRWDIDQEIGDLVFSNSDGTTATAPAQIIGSFSTSDNTWLWAWDNPSIVDAMKRDSLKVKKYGEEHKIERLTTRKWTGTEDDAWAMTALAVKLTNAKGAYRGPGGKSSVFFTFGEVKISKAAGQN